MSKNSTILQTFNNQLIEFLMMLRIFPDNMDILKTKNYISTIRKMNPRLIIQLWKEFISIYTRNLLLLVILNILWKKIIQVM